MRRWFLGVVAACLLAAGAPVHAQEFRYEVRPGDSLWDIASRYLRDIKDLPALARLNGMTDPRRMPPGAAVRIPLSLMREVMVAGTVFSVTGEVLRRAPQSAAANPVRAGQKFNERDVLQAGVGGAATLLLPDGSKIRMAEGAELEVLRMRRFADTMLFDSRLRLARGRVETEVRPLGPGGRFEILTPAAVTSVRGTDYRVRTADATSVTEVVEGRVGFGNDLGTTEVPGGFGARADAGQPPAPPRPLLPGPDLAAVPSVLGATPARLSFGAVADAARYRVQAAADPDFAQPTLDLVVDGPGLPLPATPDGALHLRVRAIDSDGIEGLEARRTIRVAAPPGSAELTLPEARHLAGAGPVRFAWKVPAGVVRSRLEFARDREFTRIVESRETEGSELLVEPPFGDDRRLYWRVTALGRETAGEPTAARSVRRAPPPAVLPPALVVAPGAVVSWARIPGVSAYRVQVLPERAQAQGAAPVFEGEVTDPALAERALIPGRYRVRVQGIDADGARGPWGEFVPLVVQEAPLMPPAGTVGDQRGVLGSAGVALVWEAAATAPPGGYRVQVARNATFQTLVLDRRVGAATRFDLPPGLPAGRYHWRVAAIGHTLESPFGEARTVDWVPGPITALPAGFTLERDAPRVTWAAMPGASAYRVDVADASGQAVATRTSRETFADLDDVGPGRYRWRVTALAEDGTPGEAGAEADLIVAPPPLAAVDLQAPDDRERVYKGSFTARWTEVPGATGYLVETSEDAAFGDGIRGQLVTGAAAEIVVPAGMRRLHWRVIPVRHDERGPASPVRTVVQPPAAVAVVGVVADPAGLDIRLSPGPASGRACVEVSALERFPPPVDRRCAAGADVRVDGLATGRWFLRGVAIDADGVESAPGQPFEAQVPEVPRPARPWWWWLPPFGLLLVP